MDEGVRPPVHDEVILLVEIGALPDMICPPIIDEEGEFLAFLLLAGRLEFPPFRLHEACLAVLRIEFAVGEEPLRADDLSVLEGGRRFLEPVRAHGAQPVICHELAAFLMAVIAVHEGVFLRLPVEAFELVGDVALAHLAEDALQVIGEPRRNQAVGHRVAGRVHEPLRQPHAPFAIHGREVHLAGCRSGQPHMRGLADLCRNDVDIDGEQPALLDRAEDRVDLRLPVAVGHG